MVFARYDSKLLQETGHSPVTGVYNPLWADRYSGGIPSNVMEISDDQYREYIEKDQRHIIKKQDDGTLAFVYVLPAEPTLDEQKEQSWQKIKVERDRREQAGVPYLGKTLDSDTISVQRIAVAVQAAQASIDASKDFSLDWTMQDNSVLTITAQQVVGMSVALAQHSDGLHRTARELREQIEKATTKEELAAIVWQEQGA